MESYHKVIVIVAVLIILLLVALQSGLFSNSRGKTRQTTSEITSTLPQDTTPLYLLGTEATYWFVSSWIANFTKDYPNIQAQTVGNCASSACYQGLDLIEFYDWPLRTTFLQMHNLFQIPISLSGAEFIYNIPGLSQSLHLNLTGPVIAGIYNGSISCWDNPQIATINPGITLPHDQIIPMHRADGSGETFLITSYLSNTSEWWNKNVSYGDVVLWPSNEASQAQSGDSGMLQGVEDQNYSIGYLSSSYLDNAMKTGNVGYAYLQNRAGNFINITALTMSSFVYPVTAYDYAVLNRLPNNSAYDYNDITFLSWVINTTEKENPSAIFNAYGYVALQQKVSQTSLGLIDEIGTCASTTTSSSRIVNGNTTSSSSTTVTSVSKTSYSSRTITSASQTTSISGYCS